MVLINRSFLSYRLLVFLRMTWNPQKHGKLQKGVFKKGKKCYNRMIKYDMQAGATNMHRIAVIHNIQHPK